MHNLLLFRILNDKLGSSSDRTDGPIPPVHLSKHMHIFANFELDAADALFSERPRPPPLERLPPTNEGRIECKIETEIELNN